VTQIVTKKRSWLRRLVDFFQWSPEPEPQKPWNDPASKVIPEPWDCPVCCCRIEIDPADGKYYRCAGCRDRAEVEIYLRPVVGRGLEHRDLQDSNGNVVSCSVVAPCGWRGRADELGKTWMSTKPRAS